eukprot:gene20364-46138_t
MLQRATPQNDVAAAVLKRENEERTRQDNLVVLLSEADRVLYKAMGKSAYTNVYFVAATAIGNVTNPVLWDGEHSNLALYSDALADVSSVFGEHRCAEQAFGSLRRHPAVSDASRLLLKTDGFGGVLRKVERDSHEVLSFIAGAAPDEEIRAMLRGLAHRGACRKFSHFQAYRSAKRLGMSAEEMETALLIRSLPTNDDYWDSKLRPFQFIPSGKQSGKGSSKGGSHCSGAGKGFPPSQSRPPPLPVGAPPAKTARTSGYPKEGCWKCGGSG